MAILNLRNVVFTFVAVAISWSLVECQLTAEGKARDKCLKSQVAGSAIERIINANPEKMYFETTDASKKYRYQIGLCQTVGDTLAAVMQFNASNSQQKFVLGRLNMTHVIKRHDYIELEYFGGDEYHSHCQNSPRTVRIMFVCDPCGGAGEPVVVEEMTTAKKDGANAHCFYLFDWPTRYACAPDHGLVVLCTAKSGVGGIVVLALLGLLVLYILLGVAYKRCFLGAKGADQFPHVDHWRMFGNLVASVYTNEHLENMDDSETEDDGDLLPLS
ncbi:cation-dependent mannose-6-phosphate receptor-like isoform X2 [Sycon ciliatum]|uniref:cation-dependent mannose-6-phosphate receptor-like isoform X2 n=1 Tax=Sycon ciliatum TaxID=27933 RepID=UPI0031F64F83